MPSDQARRLREPLSRRVRVLLGTGLGLLLTAVVLALALGHGTRLSRGCLHVDLAGAMGAEPLNQCGGAAQATCAHVREGAAQYSAVGVLNLEQACRAGRLPVG